MPAPPVPPTPKIPEPPRDLVAEQRGERVVLHWSLPVLHTDGTRITGRQRAEVFRWFTDSLDDLPARFAAEARSAYVVPEGVLETFVRESTVEFADPLGPRRLGEHAGRYAVYAVKALNLKDQAAAFSNLAAVRVHPAPQPITQIETRVTERAIELEWTPPARTTSGTPLPALASYQVYRSTTGAPESFVLLATAPAARYEDTSFRFGETYHYRIRTLAQFDADRVESEDSAVATVTPRDVFPPPAPANLIAIASAGRVDLTWDASPAADLAGYLVYRSERTDSGFARLTPTAIVAQSFGDTSVAPGKTYYYVVSAVDRDANESPRSEPTAAPVPRE